MISLLPNGEPAESSVSPADPSSKETSPCKEEFKRRRTLWARLREAAAWTSHVAEPHAEVFDAPPPRKKWSRSRRYLAVAIGLITAGGLASFAWFWSHYSAEAEKYDVAHLQRVGHGTRVVDRNGQFIGTMFSQDRKFVKAAEVPSMFVDALIATEDSRFFRHGGMDIKAVFRAMTVNLTQGSVRQGGSTITQQLARQAFELKGRTLQRKLVETFIARRLEGAYSKPEILEFYLNQIYLGSSFYGIGAAARGYFGKEVKDLTLEEAAMIVGIIKAPVAFSPYRSLDAAKRTRNLTLDRMATLGKIDGKTRDEAKAKPIKVLAEKERVYRPDYLVAAVEREMDAQRRGERPEQVDLTVDIALQTQVQEILRKHVERVEKMTVTSTGETVPTAQPTQPLQGAVVVVNNHTGEILAANGGRDYRTSPFDRALQGQRPAGTAFLPLTYAAVFSVSPEAGTSWVLDGPLDNRRVMVGGMEGILGEWGEEGERNVYEGQVSALYALFRGKTGAAVRMGYQAGLDPVRAKLEASGFASKLRNQPSILLGSSEVKVIDMARAYAAIAMKGKLPPSPALVSRIERKAGDKMEVLPVAGSSGAFTEPAAMLVRGTMVAVMQRAEMQAVLRERGLASLGLAGYGGTAYGFTDAWFVGSSQDVTCVVWLGYDAARSLGKGLTSVKTALPFWADVMAAAAKTKGAGVGWPIREGTSVLCLRSGTLATSTCLHEGEERLLVQAPSRGLVMSAVAACPYHEKAGGAVSTAPGQPIEVWKQTYTPPRITVGGIRSVTPKEPVLVGPDVYGGTGAVTPAASQKGP